MTTQRVLILQVDHVENVIYCYKKENLEVIRVRVQNLNETPSKYNFLKYTNSGSTFPDHNDIYHIGQATVDQYQKSDCIERQPNGEVLISSWIGFSDDPNHQTCNRQVAFGDWYGLLDCSHLKIDKEHQVFGSWIEIKNDIATNSASRNRPFRIRGLKHPIKGAGKKGERDDMLQRLKNYEEGLKLSVGPSQVARQPVPSTIPPVSQVLKERAITPVVVKPMEQVRRSPIRMDQENPSGRYGTPPPPQVIQPIAAPRRISTPRQSSASPVVTNIQNSLESLHFDNRNMNPRRVSPLLQGPPTTQGVALTRDNNHVIFYLTDIRKTAIYRNDVFGICLGTTFECSYQPTQQQDVDFEVLSLLRVIERQSHQNENEIVQINENRFAMRKIVDFNSPNYKFGEWYQYEGAPIMNCQSAEFAVLATMVKCGDGRERYCQDTINDYCGHPTFQWLITKCLLERQRVPRMMVDEGYRGVETVMKYVWKLIEIEGAAEVVQQRDERAAEFNLGSSRNVYEKEDDIARQKRLNGWQ